MRAKGLAKLFSDSKLSISFGPPMLSIAGLDRFADLCSCKSFNCNKLVEAGGVEPPSEKRCDTKPTCLAHFGVRPGPRGPSARSPATLRMSKKRSQLVR
jgi:hypothetical protein